VKIDPVLGLVSFPGITIGPDMSRHEFLRTNLGESAKEGVVNAGWVTLHVKPEPGIHVSLAYKNDRLVKLEVSMELPPGDDKPWDRATEMNRKSRHDAWLRSELGNPPYEYLWGSISSWFDEKSLSSDIIILFGKYPVEETWRERKARERETGARKPT
jgi:hypothetical protein